MFMEPWGVDDDPMSLMIVDDDCWWCSYCWWLWAITLYGGAHGPVDVLDGCLILWWWWWWSLADVVEPIHLMMALGLWLELTCYVLMTWCTLMEMTLPWSHDLITWWRWPCFAYLMEMTCINVMVAWWVSAMLRMTWFVDGDDISCLDMLMEMTYLDDMMTYMMPWLLMRFPYPSKTHLALQTLTHPSLLTTLPHNPTYILALTSHQPLHFALS